MKFSCNVMNCGGGKCVHEVTGDKCPYCGYELVRVKTTGHIFCCNDINVCGYELEECTRKTK